MIYLVIFGELYMGLVNGFLHDSWGTIVAEKKKKQKKKNFKTFKG